MFSFSACRGSSPKASAKLQPFSGSSKFFEDFNVILTLRPEQSRLSGWFNRLEHAKIDLFFHFHNFSTGFWRYFNKKLEATI